MNKKELDDNLHLQLTKQLRWDDYVDTKHIIANYVREMCELQKQECVKFSKTLVISEYEIIVDSNSILNCKNVCDE